MSLQYTCCVPYCNKTRLDNCILHNFPNPNRDHKRFAKWVHDIGGRIISLDNHTISKYARVCHEHFEVKYHTRSGRLSCIAVPTLNLPDSKLKKNVKQEKVIERKCILCDKAEVPGSDDQVLSSLPSDPIKCRDWLKNIGLADLALMPIKELRKKVFLCQSHFKPVFLNNCFLNNATPTENLIHPPLSDDVLEVFIERFKAEDTKHDLKSYNRQVVKSEDADKKQPEVSMADTNLNDDFAYNTEYLEDFDDNVVEQEMQVSQEINKNNSPQQVAADEIDSLFLSYAGTFKKFSVKIQTMLKLDIAKLFARYEMKHVAHCELQKNIIKKKKIPRKKFGSSTSTKTKVPRISRVIEISSYDTVHKEPELKNVASKVAVKVLNCGVLLPEMSESVIKSAQTNTPKSIHKPVRKRIDSSKASSKDQSCRPAKVLKVLEESQASNMYIVESTSVCDEENLNLDSTIESSTFQIEVNPDQDGRFNFIKMSESAAEQYGGEWEQISEDDPMIHELLVQPDQAAEVIEIVSHSEYDQS